jgi:hypothetical protein
MRTLTARKARRGRYRVPGTLQAADTPQVVSTTPLAQRRVPAGVYVGAPSESKATLSEKAPPGFEGTVKKLKGKVDNPFALAWWMKNKGYTAHEAEEFVADDDALATIIEGMQKVGDCKYVSIGGRRTCMTGGHNHSATLVAGKMKSLYYGGAKPGRIKRRAMPADMGGAAGTHGNMNGT